MSQALHVSTSVLLCPCSNFPSRDFYLLPFTVNCLFKLKSFASLFTKYVKCVDCGIRCLLNTKILTVKANFRGGAFGSRIYTKILQETMGEFKAESFLGHITKKASFPHLSPPLFSPAVFPPFPPLELGLSNPAKGSGGVIPPAGSGAEPQPKSNLVHFSLKI